MTSTMKKAHKSVANDASLDRKEEHVSSDIEGKLGSDRINGKGHSKLKTPCLTKTTKESGKKRENLDTKDKHVSSGRLGSGRSGGEGDCNAKTLSEINRTCESGKSNGSHDRKEEHVSLKNEGEAHLKALSKKKKQDKFIKKNQILDNKDEHGSLENDDRICDKKSYEGDPNFKMPLKAKKTYKYFVPLSSQKLGRKVRYSHTYKVTNSPFHNQCGATPTISPWIGGAATTRETIPFYNQCVMTPTTISPWVGAATTHETIPFHNQCGINPPIIHPWVGAATTCETIPFHNQCGINRPIIHPWVGAATTHETIPWVGAATTHETIPFHNQCGINPPIIHPWVGTATTCETIPFHNQCGMNRPIIHPWVGAATTCETIPFHNQCGINRPIIHPWVGAATTHETIPFHNQCRITPTFSHQVGVATTYTTYKPTTKKKILESGKRTENLHKKDKHVSSENNCRLGNSGSGSEGDCNLKTISNRKKRCESGKSNGSLERKEEQVSSKNEGRLSNSMDQDHAWMKPKKSVGGGTPGRWIGKLFVSNTEIAKGSSGTIVLKGSYEGRSVAVKRIVRAHYNIASQEIKSLTASDGDPNIVRLYGEERDQDFLYLALEHCACSLDDLIRAHSISSGKSVFPHDPASNAIDEYKMHLGSVEGTMQDVNLWREDGHPSPLLLKLMRGVVSGLVHLHRSGIIHRDLKPQNILITKELCAKLSDMGISRLLPGDTSSSECHVTDCGGWKASEQLCSAQQTSSVDAFGLGCVLFFCITGGRHPFGDSLKGDSNIEENTMDLSPVEFMPEAVDLFTRLLNRDPNLRPKALEVLHHPLFWNSKKRLSFLRDISDWVKSKAWGTNSDALEKLESIAHRVFDEEWKEMIDCEFMKHARKFRAYEFKRVEDLLRIVRNTFSHYRELPPEIQVIVGSSPEDLDSYFTKRFPRLLIETYRFVSMSCKDGEPSPFPEYFNS